MSEAVHPAAADGLPPLAEQTVEEHRWLAWIGTPMVIAAGFMALSFATGEAWILTFTVIVVIADIFVLLMLVLTTDTNSRPGEIWSDGQTG